MRTRRRASPLRRRRKTVEEIIHARGTVAQFARDLTQLSGERITWARVNAWKLRNNIPKHMVMHVHRLTGISIVNLLLNPRKKRTRS